MFATLIDEIIKRESVKDTDNPNDSGGRTKYGISSRWHPEAWKTGPPSLETARKIYENQYVNGPGFDKVGPEYLQAQLVDWGVTSGPGVAVRGLQTVVGVPVDGSLGPLTLLALSKRNPEVVNNQLVGEHIKMLIRVLQKSPKDLEFAFGWVTRALSFMRF